MSKLAINKNFFKKWTPNMSYILGFVVADGCVGIKRIVKSGEKRYYFNITSKDRPLLENIKGTIGSGHRIYLKGNGSRKQQNCFFLQIGSQEICKDLINLGILPRKTYHLKPISVPQKYFRDFVRGFFDGDGSVYIYTVNDTPQIKASFVSASLEFISEFNKQLCGALTVRVKSIHKYEYRKENNKRVPQYNITFYIGDCDKLERLMYGEEPVLYLHRKRKIFGRWHSISRRHYIKHNYPSKIGWRLNGKVSV